MSPFIPYLSEEYRYKALEFVENGGIWIVGPLTGIRTAEHTVHTDHALGKLEELAGIRTVFHYPITGSGAVGNAFGVKAPLTMWSSVFECRNAETRGIIEGGITSNMPFITECKRGRGRIVMLGSMPEGEQGMLMLRRLLIHYAKEANISLLYDVTPGTIVVPRKGKDFLQWAIINMDGKGGEVTLPMNCKDALTDEAIVDEKIHIEAYDCRVVEL